MAQPVQYISQYIPTDFSSVGQLANLYARDIAAADQRFNFASDLATDTASEIYGQESWDSPVLKAEADKFLSKVDELVSKRGGDYGAAAKDIARLAAKEMSNPLYQLNKRKVDQIKALEAALARNPAMLPLKDPRNIALSANLTPEDLAYELADPANIQGALTDIFGGLKTRVRESPLVNAERPGFLKTTMTKGLTQSEIAEMAQSEDVFNAIVARNPQVQKYLQDPNVANWVKTQIAQGLRGFEGGSQTQYMADPDYKDGRVGPSTQVAGPLQISGSTLMPKSRADLHTKIWESKGNSMAKREAKNLGIPGVNTLADLEKIITEHDTSKQTYRADVALTGFAPGMKPKEFKQSPYYEKAKQALNTIETTMGDEPGLGLPTYDINLLSSVDPSKIRENTTIKETMDKVVFNSKDKFIGLDKNSQKEFDAIKKDFTITDITPNYNKDNAGIILFVKGTDEENNSRQARVYLDPKDTDFEWRLSEYLFKIDGTKMLEKEYVYGKLGDKFLEELEGKLPSMTPQEQANVIEFIETKRAQKKLME